MGVWGVWGGREERGGGREGGSEGGEEELVRTWGSGTLYNQNALK